MRKVLVVIAVCAIVALGLSVMGAQAPRALKDIMTDIQTSYQSLNMAVQGGNAAQIGTDSAKLQTLFTEAGTFFTKNKVDDAAKMAKEIADAAGDIAKSKDGTKVKAGIGKCKGCHDIHREQLPDKSYKMKE
jgi:hypothetical protein